MQGHCGEICEDMTSSAIEESQLPESGSGWRMRDLWRQAKAWGLPLPWRRMNYSCNLSFSRRTRRRLGWARQTCHF